MNYLKQFLAAQKAKAILAVFLLLGQVVGTLLIPALIAVIVDQGILQNDRDAVIQTGILMLIVTITTTGISAWGSWATSDLSALFGQKMRSLLLKKSQKLSIQQFDSVGISSMITRTTSDITNLQRTMGMVLQLVVPAPIIVLVSIVMTLMISPIMALIQLIFTAVLLLIAAVVLKKSSTLSRSIQLRLDHINQVVREAVTGVRVIRAFGNEAYEEERSHKAYQSYAENMIRLNRLFAVVNPLVWLLMGVLMAAILGVGGALALTGHMAVGQITAVAEYSIITMSYLIMGASVLTTLPKASACLTRLQELLDTKPAVLDEPSQDNLQETRKLRSSNDMHYVNHNQIPAVSFEHVTFSYEGAEEPVLHDLSFTLYEGQTTAVIGSTGSGKSTLADLLLRLHNIQSGRILLRGTDIRSMSQLTLRERIGCVPQKAFLFSGTIAENLRMGHKNATEEQLWQALSIAQAEDFVRRLPLGLNAPVSQGGTNFSGGQRQRLAIARALVKKADVFLFDDSFSALDVKTDTALRKALLHHMKTPAKLVIAQRVSTIISADQILVLDNGRLVGQGTHLQLLEHCQTYREIALSQMQERDVKNGS